MPYFYINVADISNLETEKNIIMACKQQLERSNNNRLLFADSL